VDTFEREALAWAAGGRGKPLVDAAANALANGLDSSSLRMLAGATSKAADEEADEWAARAFEELGLTIHERFSSKAIVEFARLRATEFLQSKGTNGEESPRLLAAELYRYYVASEYDDRLAAWSGFDTEFQMIEDRVITGSESDLVRAMSLELEALTGNR
jgi:hypothetical protein